MLKTILALALSAAIMAALGAVGVHVLAGTEAGLLQAQEHALKAEAAFAEAEMRRLPWEPRRVTSAALADPNLATNLRALSATVEMLETATNPKLVKSLQARADLLNRMLKQSAEVAHKRMPEADTVAFVGVDGVVLYADSARWGLGDNVRDAGRDTAGKDKESTPEWLLKALAGTPAQTGVRVAMQAPYLWFTSAEPLFVKGKLAGIAIAEVPLRKPPPGVGSQILLAVDNKVVLGKVPVGFDGHLPPGKVGVVAARDIEGHAGAFSMPLVEVEPEHLGVWGTRFRVPSTDRVTGWVLQDLSDDYRDLGEKQLQVAVLAGMGWFVMALLYSFVAFSQRGTSTATRAPKETPAAAESRRERQANELMAATEPESPWGDLPVGAVETTDDGYQAMETFELGDAGQDMDSEIGAEALPPAATAHRPMVLLGDLLEITVPPQADEGDEPAAGEGWNDVRVSPESAAAAFEPAADDFSGSTALMHAADRAVAETSPQGGPSARDQLLSMLQSRKAAPAPEEREGGEEAEEILEAEPLDLLDPGPQGLEEEPPLELEMPEAEGDPVEAARQRHYRDVYEEFVRLRRSCNEPGELSYDKFLGRITDTRAAVISKHGCEDVAFAAYVKNGKAALKATPR